MWMAIVTFITAISISFVAIYYSVTGLVAIFAAAAIPIIIMGSVLEIAKLVTAVWLHKHWSKAPIWLKSYLAAAVLLLMLITSMGIFGFLSKAHIEQASASSESLAQAERIDNEISRIKTNIEKAEFTLARVEEKGTGSQAVIQTQIDKEQERIDSIYSRIQPLINEQNNIINNATKLFEAELSKIDKDLELLQNFINNGEIAKAQGMVGTKADGKYGPNTAAAFTQYQAQKSAERAEWLDKIQNADSSEAIINAKIEIQRIRNNAEIQVAESNNLISSYREKLQSSESKGVEIILQEEQQKIIDGNQQLDALLEQKFTLQANVRQLEAEVGPIKYIAELIYGDSTSRDILEDSVRYIILLIIFVFDPLAVLLLIASQYSFNYAKGLAHNVTEKPYIDTSNDNKVNNEKSNTIDMVEKVKAQIPTNLFDWVNKNKANE
jgi:hypothetical protein